MDKITRFPDRCVEIEGRSMLYFGGTSYLGMASLPRFQACLYEQIKIWGTHYGSSRNANVQLAVYEEAEQALAKYIGAQKALAVSSGMLAGQLVLETLALDEVEFYHYPQTHPAIQQQSSRPLFVNEQLCESLRNSTAAKVVICVDSMPALKTRPIALDFLNEIHPAKSITLVVDESHALGLVGDGGGGVYQHISSERLQQKITVSSLGKALGLVGGLIGANSAFIDRLQRHPKFVSASAANPAYLGTFIAAKDLYIEQFEFLKVHLAYIAKHLLPSNYFDFDQGYPVIYCKEPRVAHVLEKHGIIIAKFKYPTYAHELLRIVISAHHTKEDIEQLIEILNSNI